MTTVASPLLLTGRVVTADAVIADGAVVVDGDRITYVGRAADLPAGHGATTPNDWAPGQTLLPGLVDVHCHGGGGAEVGPDPVATAAAAAFHQAGGTTTVIGSLVSAPLPTLAAAVTACAKLVAEDRLAGIHLEGPFLSYERRGAQDPAALRDGTIEALDRLVAAAEQGGRGDAIVQQTFAPERCPADYPAALGRAGVVPAVGHTATDYATVVAALDAAGEHAPRGGRPLVTHVFNGMPQLHHREPGPVGACLQRAARGDAVLEVIGDGVHLAAGTVGMLFDAVGPDGICLITDAMAAAGMPDGDYTLGAQRVRVADGSARLAEGNSIAGGTATLLDVVRWCVDHAGVPLVDAVRAASRTPAKTLALQGVGALEVGAKADVLVVDDRLQRRSVLRAGQFLGQPQLHSADDGQ